MKTLLLLLSSLLFLSTAVAVPASNSPLRSPVPTAAARVEDRTPADGGAVNDVLSDALSSLDEVISEISLGNLVGTLAWSSISSAMQPVTATTTQTDAVECMSTLSAIHSSQPSADLFQFAASLVAEGLTTQSISDIIDFVTGAFTGENNMNNVNPDANSSVYPTKVAGDAPYSVDEDTLRGAIYIPSNFTYGTKQPVILFPGTGNTGYITFQGNFIQTLTGVDYADPVWVNVPGLLLDDAQKNAEFIAYAINYISGISQNVNVSVIAWSQGNIDTQWAFKYWPSTREVTNNHIAISPDYAGTVEANLICPDGLPCDASVFQQQYMEASNFITTLRNDNGDSAYVPTTVVYSALFDEIVEPQQGVGASAFLNDVRGVGVTNNEAQTVCIGLIGGSFYTHEGMLYNPLSFALAEDALTNGGPGLPSRVDLTTVCNQYLAVGLNIGDFLVTENAIVVAGLALVLHEPKVTEEPVISAYAVSSASSSV